MPFLRRPDGGAINPAWAEYALLRIEHGAPQIELRRVAYDLDRYVTDVRDSGMPHARWWPSRWRPARIERA